jgi:glutathione S-transferase
MEHAISIAQAREQPGLRLVLLRGVPSPWGQAAKGILELKGIPFTPVHTHESDAPDALRDWTGQDSYPAAMYADEAPRSGWAEILLLAERLAHTPALIPAEPEMRASFFGYAHEICGELGLGWCRRLQTVSHGLKAETVNPISSYIAAKYGYREAEIAQADARVVAVLGALDALLARSGGSYLMGQLSALDVYWATFCNLVAPLPPDQLPMPEALRPMFTASEPATLAALTPELLALRDRVYEHHLRLPIEL